MFGLNWKKLIEYLVAGLRGSPPPARLDITPWAPPKVIPGFSIVTNYPLQVQDWHSIYDSQPWCLLPSGVSVPGDGGPVVSRTPGEPVTVTRIMQNFGEAIEKWGRVYDVPRELIIACIATESRGKPKAYREEPGFVNQYKTPNKVSAGLMQTLVSTAQKILSDPEIDVNWLIDPGNSIQAGTAYIAAQRQQTRLDPPKVAAAYNAGGLYRERSEANPWKMRCWPLGTGRHITKFVEFYNDAVGMINQNDGILGFASQR